MRYRLLLVLVFSVAAAQLWAEQKTDERLSQKITYTAQDKALKAILVDLTELTGVKLEAGSSEDDWQVRDRRMRILVKDVQLTHLMNSIARVMKFRWISSGDNSTRTHRLHADQESLAEEQRLLKRWEQMQKDLPRKQMEGVLKLFEGLKSRYEEDPDGLRKENALLYAYARSGAADAILRLCKETPGVREALLSGQPARFGGSDIPAAILDDLPQIMQSFAAFRSMSGSEEPGVSGEPVLPGANVKADPQLAMVWVNEDRRQSPSDGDFWAHMILGDIAAGCIMLFGADLHLLAPDSQYWQLSAQAAQAKARAGPQVPPAQLFAAMRADVEKLHTGEPRNPKPDAEALNKQINVITDEECGMTLSDLPPPDFLTALAAASSLGVVSDSHPEPTSLWSGAPEFARTAQGVPESDEEVDIPRSAKLVDVLDTFSDEYDCNWDCVDGILEFRDRHWFAKRSLQVPDALIDKWRAKLKTTGKLEIDDLAEIADLSREQMRLNLSRDDDLALLLLGSSLESDYEILHLYAALTETQRQQLLTDNGLDLRTLAPDQLERVQAIRDRLLEPGDWLSAPPKDPGTLASLTAKVVVSETGARGCEFTLKNTNGDEVGFWQVSPYRAEQQQPP